MKFFTLTLLALVLSTGLFAQTIANAGFENWTFYGTYEDVDSWTTLNSLTDQVHVYTAYKDSTYKHNGSYSLRLITKTAANHTAPGVLTTGQINEAEGVHGGQPINSKPQFLSGWYRSAPQPLDTASFEITLTKAHVQIGYGRQAITHNVSTWTSFSIPVNYSNQMDTPDSVQVTFYSSQGTNMSVGTTIWLDDITYDQIVPTGINESTPAIELSVYPNPASGMISLNNTDAQAKTADVYSVEGKLVRHFLLREGVNQLDIATLSAGHYVVSATGSNGSAYRSTIVVK